MPDVKKTTDQDELFTLREGCKILNISYWQLRDRIMAGQIPFVRYPGGRKILLRGSDLKKFVDQNVVGG